MGPTCLIQLPRRRRSIALDVAATYHTESHVASDSSSSPRPNLTSSSFFLSFFFLSSFSSSSSSLSDLQIQRFDFRRLSPRVFVDEFRFVFVGIGGIELVSAIASTESRTESWRGGLTLSRSGFPTRTSGRPKWNW